MALLQISEPNKKALSATYKLAVGIDLGTTNSLVARVKKGHANIIENQSGERLLPSAAYYGKLETLFGGAALTKIEQDPSNTIVSIKRLLGLSFDDISLAYPHLPYKFKPNANNMPTLLTAQGDKNPIEISADILKSLHEIVKHSCKKELSGVVITVPAYFNDAQRASTKEAATLAGLNVLRLLNEPTAAAIAYGLDSKQEGIIAVYDLGGGTFDISLLRLSKGVFEVLATGGNSALGGDDFDLLLAQYLSAQAGFNLHTLSASDHRRLLNIAIDTKIQLSTQIVVTVNVLDKWQGQITKEQFNELILPLVQKTLLSCRRALKDAQLDITDIDNVVMVGGSTRVTLVQKMVTDFFALKPLTHINPDEVVALGAAIQADILVGNKPEHEMLLLDVLPLSLGIETMGGIVEKIIMRNTTIPIIRAQEFTTFKDGQTAMSIHVLQGEREMVQDCRSIAHFTLKGIPPMVAGAAHIQIIYQVDADGLLSVSAIEKSTQIKAHIQAKPSYGLTVDKIANMLEDSIVNAQEDMQSRALAQQKVEAARVIESLLASIKLDGDELLTPKEKLHLLNEAHKLDVLKQTGNAKAIATGIKKLDLLSQNFAARRMDKSILLALQGQSINDL